MQSNWNLGGGTSIDHGYGLMDLTAATTLVRSSDDERGTSAPSSASVATGTTGGTLNQAALLLGVTPERVATDPASNVLGGALLLAKDALAFSPSHRLPTMLGGWAPVLSSFTGITTANGSARLLHDVYSVLAQGLSRSDDAGDSLTIAPQPAAATLLKTLSSHALKLNASSAQTVEGADYPGAIWAPSPNMTDATRPTSLPIQYVVIHDTEGGCAASLNWLLNPVSGGSAHFLVCRDGTVYQLVHIHDIAWHAGNWYINEESIGIEHEGFRDSGGYTSAQYAASAAIVRWLDRVYGLTLHVDRTSIIGHENVPSATHTDPGPLWDWPGYMSLLRGDAYDGGDPSVAMAASAQIVVRACPATTCTVEGTANWGEQFAVVGVAFGWKEINYNGAVGWLDASSIVAGSGTRLQALTAVHVRDEADLNGAVVGVIPAGQVYVSRLLDTSVDPAGWWFIAYNHRYGFVSAAYMAMQTSAPNAAPTFSATATPLPVRTPTTIPTRAPSSTALPAPVSTPTLSPTVTPTLVLTSALTLVPTATPSALPPSPTATTTPSPSPSATMTPSPTVILTATPSPSPSATLAPTPTAGPTITPVIFVRPLAARQARTHLYVSPRPTATPRRRVTPRPTIHPARQLRPRPVPHPTHTTTARTVVVVVPAHVRLKAVLRLHVRSNKRKALLWYWIALPGGVALRARSTTDAHGNAVHGFTMPGDRWLHLVLLERAHRIHGKIVMPRVPHSIGGTYRVIVTVGKTRIIRKGTFQVVLWRPFT